MRIRLDRFFIAAMAVLAIVLGASSPIVSAQATLVRAPAKSPAEPNPAVLEQRVLSIVDKVVHSTVSIETNDGLGSGTILDTEGRILTSAHVIEGCSFYRVTLADGRRFSAERLGINTTADLALLKIKADGLKPAVIGDPEKLHVWDFVVAAGHPTSVFTDAQPTLSLGILHQLDGAITTDVAEKVFVNSLVTDAPISPGSSGGGLFNLAGELIGVNAAVTKAETRGFAVRISEYVCDREALETKDKDFKRAPTVRTIEDARGDETFSRSDYFDRSFKGLRDSLTKRVVTVRSPSGLVRGALVSRSGDILTVASAFLDMPVGTEVVVRMSDDPNAKATLTALDRTSDVALLRLPEKSEGYDFLDIEKISAANRGVLALALGSDSLQGGIVSARHRVPPLDLTGETYYPDVTQVDLRLGPMAIGGAVVDKNGGFIGILLQHRLQRDSARRRGGPCGAFVLPGDVVAQSYAVLKTGKSIGPRPVTMMGVPLQDLDEETAKRENIADGVLVQKDRDSWWPGGPADKAGILPGDVILKIGGQPVNSRAAAILRIRSFNRGDKVSVAVSRDGKAMDFEVVMGDKSDLLNRARPSK